MKQETLHQALAKAQSEFPSIKKTENNPYFKSKYASLSNVLEAVTSILHKNGLYFSQSPTSEGDRVGVKTRIIHADSGEMLEESFVLPLAKADPQGAGSAITYARRYALVSMLGLNMDEDDDGNLASGKGHTTQRAKGEELLDDSAIY